MCEGNLDPRASDDTVNIRFKVRTLTGPKNLFESANVSTIGHILLGSEAYRTNKFVRI